MYNSLPIASQPAGAIFSPCDRYRYVLWRRWHTHPSLVLFIGLNPSTADQTVDDPTIRRCTTFARAWGYGGVVMTNLFSYRASQPTELRHIADPVGPETDGWIVQLCSDWASQGRIEIRDPLPPRVIAMWGNAGQWWGRDRAVLALISPIVTQLYCLAITQQGQPAHPLYRPKTLIPKLYPGYPISP